MFNSTSDTKGTKDEETELTIAFNMLLLVTLMRGLSQDSGRKKKKLPPPTITTKTLARVDLRENTGEDTEKELRCCFHGVSF